MTVRNCASIVVAGVARTPFGRFGGELREMSLPDLGATAVVGALRRSGLSANDVDELAFGVNLPGSDRSIARQVQLRSGIPEDRVAYTVDRACCSSLAAVTMTARAIQLGEATVAVAGGAENLSRIPYFLEDLRWGKRLGNITMTDQLLISCPHTGVPRAVQAGEEAATFAIGREEQDEWALRSQLRFAAAQSAGKFADEIVAVKLASVIPAGVLNVDESPRPATTLASLSELPTVYGSPTVTAGNAPGLSTGGTALVLTTDEHAKSVGAPRLAKILATSQVSGAPERVASIPATAATTVLAKAEVDLADVALIEINEAFAAVPLVTTLLLAHGTGRTVDQIRDITNVNGGSIAVGHPTGATGVRLIMTIVGELHRRGGGIGLVTMCGGIGEGAAILLQVS